MRMKPEQYSVFSKVGRDTGVALYTVLFEGDTLFRNATREQTETFLLDFLAPEEVERMLQLNVR